MAALAADVAVGDMDEAALRAEVERLRAGEKAREKATRHLQDRAEQKIRAAAAKCERMEKKHEKEKAELEEKRAELTRVYGESREARQSSEKSVAGADASRLFRRSTSRLKRYKFEWDRAKEEIDELNNKSMRAWTQQRIHESTYEDEKERHSTCKEKADALEKKVAALEGAGDKILILQTEIKELRAGRAADRATFEADLETAKAALRAEADKAPPVCPSCGYQAGGGGRPTRYDPAHY